MVPVTGAFHGRLRVVRQTGLLDTEGLDRVLSEPSARALSLALQLVPHGATLVAWHIDKGGGEDILREAMSYGVEQAILVEAPGASPAVQGPGHGAGLPLVAGGSPSLGALSANPALAGGHGAHASNTSQTVHGTHAHPTPAPSDASVRATTLADAYAKFGPFDLVIGPSRSEFAGFTGALAAMAGQLDLPVVVGVEEIQPDGPDGFRIRYASLFGDYDLRIPRPCVVLAGDVARAYPTAWGIHDAHRVRGILRLQADQLAAQRPNTRRLRIEAVTDEVRTLETVDGTSLVRRMRSRALVGDPPKGDGA